MQKKRRRGRSLLAKNKPKNMLKRTYLEPNRNTMQKPIGGLSATLLPELYKGTINKGAIDCSKRI
jgi:hypothetical protein